MLLLTCSELHLVYHVAKKLLWCSAKGIGHCYMVTRVLLCSC